MASALAERVPIRHRSLKVFDSDAELHGDVLSPRRPEDAGSDEPVER